MLITMLLDEDADESTLTALFQVGAHVMRIQQRPSQGRQLDEVKEAAQEQGLMVWQAGFVLADWLLRQPHLQPWAGKQVLELGCGVGQLGIALAMSGAAVLLTDLPHIVPLTAHNVSLNASAYPGPHPRVAPYLWGTRLEVVPAAAAPSSGDTTAAGGWAPPDSTRIEAADSGRPECTLTPATGSAAPEHASTGHGTWDVVVAADVLYEPQYYDMLLDSLCALVLGTGPCSSSGSGAGCCGAAAAEAGNASATGASAVAAASASESCAVSPQCYLCYRIRRYNESGFEQLAKARGFDVTVVPAEELHDEYRDGWRLIQLHPMGSSVNRQQGAEGS